MPATSSDPEALSQAEIDRRRGRIVPWAIAAFYLTFMATLIGFVVIAYRHPPNDVTAEAYEKGLAYNATLDAADRQARLGWTSSVGFKDRTLTFRLSGRDGKPVTDAQVEAWFVHPDESAFDRKVSLAPGEPGVYQAHVDLPQAANWSVHVTAVAGGGEYQTVADVQAP